MLSLMFSKELLPLLRSVSASHSAVGGGWGLLVIHLQRVTKTFLATPHLYPWGLAILVSLGTEVFPMDSSIFSEWQEAGKARQVKQSHIKSEFLSSCQMRLWFIE